MADTYDVQVIGAGPAGEHAAGRVAIVERELVGGECSYWGCIPSKTLIRPGDVLAAARRAPGAAEAVTGQLDASAAFAQRDYMTSGWRDDGQARWLESKGIGLIRGTGRLTGSGRSRSRPQTAPPSGFLRPGRSGRPPAAAPFIPAWPPGRWLRTVDGTDRAA